MRTFGYPFRRVSQYVYTAPLPAAIAVNFLFLLVLGVISCWPFIVASPGSGIGPLLLTSVVGPIAERSQVRQLTGWTPARVLELVDRLRQGEPPADPADRDRLRTLLSTELKQRRAAVWVPAIGGALLGVLILLLRRDRYPGHLEWFAASWLLLVGLFLSGCARRGQGRRGNLLARLPI